MGRRKINDCERGSEAPQVLYSPLSYGDNLHYEKFADGSVKCIEDEIPFELPDGWAWSRLGAVAEAIGDGDHQPPPQTSFGVPFLVISNVSGGRLSFENTRFVSKEYFSQLPETRKPRNGDLLFTVTGSYGIPVLIDSDDKFCFQRHIAIVRPCTISNRYLYVILGSSYVKSICDAKATGTAQKTVGLATLRELLIPVAPYKEQMQIYAQTQDALSITDSNLNHTGIYLYSKGKIMIHLTFDYKTDEKCTTPGQYLKYHRTFQGLSTRELAEKVGIVPATLVLYENDRHPIKHSTAVALANALGIDRNRLLDKYTAFVDYPYSSFLKKVRQDLSLTQIQMAELIGIGQTSYSGWEREIRVPRRKEYDKILAALEKLRVNVDTYLCQSASI